MGDIVDKRKKEAEQAEKREARRKRRQRNQVLAYLAVILFIILLAVGIVLGVKYMTGAAEDKQQLQPELETGVEDPGQPEDQPEQPQEDGEDEEAYTPPTYEQKLDMMVNAAIEVMPLEDKIAGLFILSPEALLGKDKAVTAAGDETREALAKNAVGGILFDSRNMKNQEDFRKLLEDVVLYSKYPIFLAVEEESGSTSKVTAAHLGEQTQDAVAIALTQDPGNAYQTGKTMGNYLSGLGVTLCLGPVADLCDTDNSLMATRSFGSDPTTALDYVQGMSQGLQEMGVNTCFKHFPGLGSVQKDTTEGPVVSERTREEFNAGEFQLYQSLIDSGAGMIMVSNMAAPGLTGDNTPCTLSRHVVTEILREELDYDGLIITDALGEKAISEYYTSKDAAILALKAGCDMILAPEDYRAAYEGILEAVGNGTISESRIDDALRRVYRLKYADRVEK